MLNAHFIVCHNKYQDSSVSMHQHVATGIFMKPDYALPGNTVPLEPLLGQATSTKQTCLFKRPLAPSDGYFPDLSGSIKLLWAFGYKPYYNVDECFDFHGFSNMGRLAGSFQTAFTAIDVVSTVPKKIHGFGMMVVWLLIFPTGAYVARYMKSLPGWVAFKTNNQSLGILIALVLIILVSTNYLTINSHTILGWCILCAVVVLMLVGSLNLLGYTEEQFQPYKKMVRLAHRICGYSVLFMALFQIGLGINMLYPWVRPQYVGIWYLYFITIGCWFLIFGVSEFCFHSQYRIREAGYSRLDKRQDVGPLQIQKSSYGYTWETIAEEVNKGKLLVVANTKFVYDISTWIDSHPGGRLILQEVAGTDISNDYFHSAGFDAAQFIPKTKAPKKIASRTNSASNLVPAPSSSLVDAATQDKLRHLAKNIAEEPGQELTETDWKYIKKARRTHIHTRLAIQRLAKLMVGEMQEVESPQGQIMATNARAAFDPYEFRRYALTEIEELNAPEKLTQYAKFKFCLLYPYDRRSGSPSGFLPGQYVDIQVRTQGGQLLTRSYCAQTGNMSSFDVLVKKKWDDKSKMSGFLFSQTPGERQYKIRGPFGVPLIGPPQSWPAHESLHDGVEDVIYFFAAGSGMTPFIQLVNSHLLPLNAPVPITKAFNARRDDELSVRVGDAIMIEYHYLDGWCFGTNWETRQQGIFPVRCTTPLNRTKLVLIAFTGIKEELVASDLCIAAKEAYPDYIELYSFNRNLFRPVDLDAIMAGNRTSDYIKVVVCGPPRMNQDMNEMLQQNASKWNLDLRHVRLL
ncbi:hypothetical protein HDU91_006773 [Kappamyces sp. JEL0680]|nr:hypothetical protein HDU91_006773 [Kappamyces sp. JEL0680]